MVAEYAQGKKWSMQLQSNALFYIRLVKKVQESQLANVSIIIIQRFLL